MQSRRALIVGAGSWGTALAWLLAQNDWQVDIAGRAASDMAVAEIQHRNPRYLPDTELPASVDWLALDRLEDRDYEFAVLAVPADAVPEVWPVVAERANLWGIATKGFVPGNAQLLSEYAAIELPRVTTVVLSGPNLAQEIVRGIPTVALAASTDVLAARTIAKAFHSPRFRVSPVWDVVGVEVAGAVKNVLAIGAGMSDGLGFGDNTKGAFLSRGLMEMARLGVAMGGDMETFLGPAGVGDLFATAGSKLSRNYRFGFGLGQGASTENALRQIGQVVEGVRSSDAAIFRADALGQELPILRTVNRVIRGELSATVAVEELMNRP